MKKLDRVDKLLLIQEQVKAIETLKDKIYLQIPCDNNAGYDFYKPEHSPLKLNIPESLKNAKGQTLSVALAELNEKLETTIDEFKTALDDQVSLMYQETLKNSLN